jgi:hypothetical protein
MIRPSQELTLPQKPPRTRLKLYSPPYTEEEKAWLRKNWKNEFHFLASYQLRIYDEDDREEGRTILRAFMKDEGGYMATEAEKSDQVNGELKRKMFNAELITLAEEQHDK